MLCFKLRMTTVKIRNSRTIIYLYEKMHLYYAKNIRKRDVLKPLTFVISSPLAGLARKEK
jgi:hypothetical protein